MNKLQKWTNRFILHVFLSLVISFAGVIVGMLLLPQSAAYFCNFILIGTLLVTTFMKKDNSISMSFGYFFFFIDGVTLFPIISYYIGTESLSFVIGIFILTIAITGALAGYGYMTKKDLSSMGCILFAALLSLVVVSLVNLFIGSGLLEFIICYVGIIVFCFYIVYDINKLKQFILAGRINCTNDLTWHVMNIYLDIVNLLLKLLRALSTKD